MGLSKKGNAQALIIDNGTGFTKAGFAGDDGPRCVFPAILGRPRNQKYILPGLGTKSVYVGNEANKKRGILRISFALQSGKVTNWDDMETLWKYTFTNQLRVVSEEHPVLLTEAPENPKYNREKMVSLMFDKFGVQGVYVCIQAVLALYSSGRTTGVSLDIGDGVSHTVPIYETYAIPHAIERLDLAGRNITKYFSRLLQSKGYGFKSNSDQKIVEDMKEKLCYVALDYKKELEKSKDGGCDKEYELPDGRIITLGQPRFEACESLFNPSMLGMEAMGVDQLVLSTISKCDIDLRRDLYNNVVLSGGSTMFNGFADRLNHSLVEQTPTSIKIKVVDPKERKYSVWIGGSILGSLDTFKDMWITKEDYEEAGAKIVHSKCF